MIESHNPDAATAGQAPPPAGTPAIASHHLDQICEAMGVAILSLAKDETITSWHSAAERLLGYTGEDVTGRPFTAIFPGGARITEVLTDAAKGQPSYDVPMRCRASSGELIPVSLSLFVLSEADSDSGGFVALIRDARSDLGARVALRVATEQQRRTQDLLSAIVDNSTSAIHVKDTHGCYQLVNREWERIVGIPRERAVGQLDTEVFPPEMVERFRLHDQAVIAQRRPLEFEEPGAATDGEPHIFRSSRIPLFGPTGEVERICGFSTDITDQKRSHMVTDLARQAAESANRSKTEFLSRMSHELRTPLNVVLGFAQVLQLDELTDDQQESVDHILKAGRHLLDLIDEVLDLSRIEANRMPLSLEPLAAGEMLREVIGLIGSLSAARGISVELRPENTHYHIRADRQRIKQVMLNLLSNAIKYNRDHGHVTVACDLLGADQLRISVADTGIGIRPDRMDRLFDAFDRLGAEATGVEGTGLGLALSHRLARAMGGDVGAHSVVGEGTTIWIDLPLAHDPAEPDAAGTVGDTPIATAKRIERSTLVLYIEDNLANVRLVERLVRRVPGARLLPAMQGSLGIDLAREHLPDLIILDLHLPDLPGERVLAELIADPRTKGIPVVAASADATPGAIERLLAAGAAAYLTKPFDVNEFLRVVTEISAPG